MAFLSKLTKCIIIMILNILSMSTCSNMSQVTDDLLSDIYQWLPSYELVNIYLNHGDIRFRKAAESEMKQRDLGTANRLRSHDYERLIFAFMREEKENGTIARAEKALNFDQNFKKQIKTTCSNVISSMLRAIIQHQWYLSVALTLNLNNKWYLNREVLQYLEFADHAIKMPGPGFAAFSDVDLNGNNLDSLQKFSFGGSMDCLSIADNKFTRLDHETCGMPFAVKYVDVSNNPIQGVIDFIACNSTLTMLKFFNMKGCKYVTRLVNIPNTLQILNIVDSGITSPDQLEFENEIGLKAITTNRNQIKQFQTFFHQNSKHNGITVRVDNDIYSIYKF